MKYNCPYCNKLMRLIDDDGLLEFDCNNHEHVFKKSNQPTIIIDKNFAAIDLPEEFFGNLKGAFIIDLDEGNKLNILSINKEINIDNYFDLSDHEKTKRKIKAILTFQ